MSRLKQFLIHIKRHGQSAVYHKITGDACPCVNNDTGYFDREWHRQNPGAEDCNGTGLINRTDTTTNIKAFILPKADVDEITMEKIGLRSEDDHFFMGAFDEANESLFDVSGFDERRDYIVFQGNSFILRNIDAERIGDEIMYYYGLLKRIEN